VIEIISFCLFEFSEIKLKIAKNNLTGNWIDMIFPHTVLLDHLCGLVVRVPGYRSMEWGPLSLVRIIEELLEWKSSGSGVESRINGSGGPLR
jgi:hypothetical protein